MTIYQTHIPNCVWTFPSQYIDRRGVFCELFKMTELPWFKPIQSNYSFSKKGVLRGIHRTPYAKLVTCVSGQVYDVCVDLRPDSPTYKSYFGIVLNPSNLHSLYIPPYCGHAFLAMEDSVMIYQQDNEYNKEFDETYCYQNYNIAWPIPPAIISDKDSACC